MQGNGGLRFGAHQYVNVNDVQHTGSAPLQLEIGGKNDGARGVAAMLGVTTDAAFNLAYLSMNSAAIEAPRTAMSNGGTPFTVTDGNIRDNLYLNLGADGGAPFMARIGRLEDNALNPDSWLLAGAETGYFDDGIVQSTTDRSDDYRCTGLPAYIGNANAVFDFSFTFQRPFVDCSGVLNYYAPAYSLLNVEQTADQQVLGQVAGILQQLTETRSKLALLQACLRNLPRILYPPWRPGLRGQQLDIQRGFIGEAQGQVAIGTQELENTPTQPIGVLLEQGLDVAAPDAIIDLDALEENAELEDDGDVLIQQSSLEAEGAPAS